MISKIKWEEHVPKVELYGDLPKMSDQIAARRLALAGHCQYHPELPANKLDNVMMMMSEGD